MPECCSPWRAGWVAFPPCHLSNAAAAGGFQPQDPRRESRRQVRGLPRVPRRRNLSPASPRWINARAATPRPWAPPRRRRTSSIDTSRPTASRNGPSYARQPENVYFSHIAHVKLRATEMRAMPRQRGRRRDAAAIPGGPHQRLLARHLGTARDPHRAAERRRHEDGRLRGLPPPAGPGTQLPGLPQIEAVNE